MEKEIKKIILGKYQRGVNLSSADFELLFFIYKHRLVTLQQIQTYASAIMDIKEDSVRIKLIRWASYEIIEEYKYHAKAKKISYYHIGSVGMRILNDHGWAQCSYFYKPGNNLEHWFGIQDVVVAIEKMLKVNQIEYSSFHSAENPYLDTNYIQPKVLISPDWRITTVAGELEIELDRNTERLRVIQEKVKKYTVLSDQNPNQIFNVLFVVMDNSVIYEKEHGKEKSRRISAIKGAIQNVAKWEQPNLNFYVTSSTCAPDLGFKILSEKYPLNGIMKSNEVDMAIQLLTEINKRFPYAATVSDKSIYYPNYIEHYLQADAHVTLTDKVSKVEKHLALIVMEEGNVNCWDRLKYLNLLVREAKFKKKIFKVIAIYLSKDEFSNDIIGENLENVLFGYSELWLEQQDLSPRFYYDISQSKRRMTRFDQE